MEKGIALRTHELLGDALRIHLKMKLTHNRIEAAFLLEDIYKRGLYHPLEWDKFTEYRLKLRPGQPRMLLEAAATFHELGRQAVAAAQGHKETTTRYCKMVWLLKHLSIGSLLNRIPKQDLWRVWLHTCDMMATETGRRANKAFVQRRAILDACDVYMIPIREEDYYS